MEPLISIVILNYNSGHLLIGCVDSIKNSNYNNYEIILVDNASSDKSHLLCKERYPEIKLIQNKENLGYGEGNNVGMDSAKGEFLAIANPDVILKENCLNELLEAYKKNGSGLYQPKLLVMGNESLINSAGNEVQTFGFGFSRGKGETDCESYNKPQQIGFASGAFLFTTKKLMDQLGRFEPYLFAYHDDMDVGWKAAKIGVNSYYVPSAIVKHAESHSFAWDPQKFYLLERNRQYCILVHYSKKTIVKMLPSLILIEGAMLLFFLSKKMFRQKLRAYKSIINNRKYISKKHKESESLRKISDKEVLRNFVDVIFVPEYVSSSFNNKIFNKVIVRLSRLVRKII